MFPLPSLHYNKLVVPIRKHTFSSPLSTNITPCRLSKRRRGWQWGKIITKELLQKQSTLTRKIHEILHAHQHSGPILDMLIENNGIVSLWNGLVHTFLSVPAMHSNFSFKYDSFGILILSNQYDMWHLEHII